jgi:predicted nucleic-acid-binding protein
MSDMVKKLIDANLILRYLLKDDETLFEKAFFILEKVKTGNEKVIIIESVLTECVYVLAKVYKVNRLIISEKLCDLFYYKGVVNPDKKDLIDAIILFGKTNLSIVDCILCVRSKNYGMPLFTFDEDLKNICSL